jgi:hypothetical protein
VVHCCAYTLGYPSPKALRDHLSLVFGPRGFIAVHKKVRTHAPKESPTNVRCKALHLIKIILAYSPRKKEQTSLKTGVRYNKAISVHLLTEPYADVTAHTAPSQQVVSFPLEVMQVWINRHQTLVDIRFFFFSRS